MTQAEKDQGMRVATIVGTSIAVFTFLIQLFVIVWGAAKIDSAVDSLARTTSSLGENLKVLTETVNEHSGILILLDERVNNKK